MLNFENEKYLERALKDARGEYEKSSKSVIDAFFLLIEGEEFEDLENLCQKIKEFYRGMNLSLQDCYKLTQGRDFSKKMSVTKDIRKGAFLSAYMVLISNKTIGNKTINEGKINTSDWMGHCLWVGELAAEIAYALELDWKKAMKMGILHDYGRKQAHNLLHIVIGYERLSDKGWNEEALACLTHSFLNGKRYAWCDQPDKGFFIDQNGNPGWLKDAQKDNIAIFLDNYTYTEYDVILNIADLMATGHGIISPAERVADIWTRRQELQPRQKGYFLANFSNTLMKMVGKLGEKVPEDMKSIKAEEGRNLEEITRHFLKASDIWMQKYNKSISKPLMLRVDEL